MGKMDLEQMESRRRMKVDANEKLGFWGDWGRWREGQNEGGRINFGDLMRNWKGKGKLRGRERTFWMG